METTCKCKTTGEKFKRHKWGGGKSCVRCWIPRPKYMPSQKAVVDNRPISAKDDPLASGYDAFKRGEGRHVNPFLGRGDSEKQWDEGWAAAKEDAGRRRI